MVAKRDGAVLKIFNKFYLVFVVLGCLYDGLTTIDAIDVVPSGGTAKIPRRKKMARVDGDRCLGCGVCHAACEFDGLHLEAAPRRIYTPENVMEKLALQAIERGKLQGLLFNDPGRISHRTLGALLRVVLSLAPAKQALANRQLKSRFVSLLTGSFRRGVAETRVVASGR